MPPATRPTAQAPHSGSRMAARKAASVLLSTGGGGGALAGSGLSHASLVRNSSRRQGSQERRTSLSSPRATSSPRGLTHTTPSSSSTVSTTPVYHGFGSSSNGNRSDFMSPPPSGGGGNSSSSHRKSLVPSSVGRSSDRRRSESSFRGCDSSPPPPPTDKENTPRRSSTSSSGGVEPRAPRARNSTSASAANSSGTAANNNSCDGLSAASITASFEAILTRLTTLEKAHGETKASLAAALERIDELEEAATAKEQAEVAEALAAYDRGQEELRASQAAFQEAQEMEAMVNEEDDGELHREIVSEGDAEDVGTDNRLGNNGNAGDVRGEMIDETGQLVEAAAHGDAAAAEAAATATAETLSLAARVVKLEALAEESWAKQDSHGKALLELRATFGQAHSLPAPTPSQPATASAFATVPSQTASSTLSPAAAAAAVKVEPTTVSAEATPPLLRLEMNDLRASLEDFARNAILQEDEHGNDDDDEGEANRGVLRASLLHFDDDHYVEGEGGAHPRRDGPCSRDDTRIRDYHTPHAHEHSHHNGGGHASHNGSAGNGSARTVADTAVSSAVVAEASSASVVAVRAAEGKSAENVLVDQEGSSLRATEGSLFGAANLRATEDTLVGNHARYSTPSSSNNIGMSRSRSSITNTGNHGGFDRSAAESVDLSELGEGIASVSEQSPSQEPSHHHLSPNAHTKATTYSLGSPPNNSSSSGSSSSSSRSQMVDLDGRQSTEKLEYAGAFAGVRGPQKSSTGGNGAMRSAHTKRASDLSVDDEEEATDQVSHSCKSSRGGFNSSSSSSSKVGPASAGKVTSPTATAGGKVTSSSPSSVTSPEAQLDKLLQLELSYARALAMNARPPPPLSPELPHSFADDDDDDNEDSSNNHKQRSSNSSSRGSSSTGGADNIQQEQRTNRESREGPVLPRRFQSISSSYGTGSHSTSSSSSSQSSSSSKSRRSLISAYVDSRRLSSSSAAAIAARLGHSTKAPVAAKATGATGPSTAVVDRTSTSSAPEGEVAASVEATPRASKEGWSEPPRPPFTVVPRSPLKPPPPL